MLLFASVETTAASTADTEKRYNVTSYGADITGSTSSDAAVTSALADARKDISRNNLDGRQAVIYFPAGKYVLNSAIKLSQGMSLSADSKAIINGTDSRLIRLSDTQNTCIEGGSWSIPNGEAVITATRCSNITIQNLEITHGNFGIKLSNSSAMLSDVTIANCNTMGLSITNDSKATADRCTITKNGYVAGYTGNGQGILVHSGSRLTITDSQIISNRSRGISVNTATAVVKNCKLKNNGTHGLGTTQNASVTMSGCEIRNNGGYEKEAGVSILKNSTATITNCKFLSNAAAGLEADGAGTKVTLKKCVFKGNKTHNIICQEVDAGKITLIVNGCTFYKTPVPHDCIRLTGKKKSTFKVTLTNNNKFKNIKHKITYIINNKISYK